MNQMQNIISYFRACYQTDNRGLNLANFFGNKVESQIMLNGAELIEGKLMQYPINSEWAEKAQKTLKVYAREKELYCAAFFLLGQSKILGKTHKVCAPLLLYQVEIVEENEIYYLQLTNEINILNPSFMEFLRGSANENINVNEHLFHNLPGGLIDFEALHQIRELLEQSFPDLDTSQLEKFPELLKEKQIKTTLSKIDNWKVVPACGVGILKKSTASRGILNELEILEKAQDFPEGLKNTFFPNPKSTNRKLAKTPTYVPANLSGAQTTIIHSTEQNPSTLVIGPPGTGKSFTIAAMAIDAISKGKSVLISSKNDQALDVIAHKIKKDFGFENLVLQGGKRDYKRILKQRISNLLNNIGVTWPSMVTIIKQRKEINALTKRINELEAIVQKREQKEIDRGYFLNIKNPGLIKKLKSTFLFWKMDQEIPLWDKIKELQQKIDRRNNLIKKYVDNQVNANIHASINNHRESFQMLQIALSARTGTKKETYFNYADFKQLLVAFPIWLVKAADISTYLPLTKDLFDMVIIDEATQCDIASAIPLLYRAKNMVVVGDPKQLRHVSFLSKTRQESMQKSHGVNDLDSYLLNYRDNSILDIVSRSIKQQSQVHFLDEHYRSLPDIIRFSNEYFYDNALKIMTHTPKTILEKNTSVLVCEGKKEKRGFNKLEADTILIAVRKIIAEEALFDASLCQSIGILSPFREQVNHIQKKVTDQFELTLIERHNLMVGTPYAFQGEERDIMFISFAIDESSHPSVFQYLNKEDVFNVSITRARNAQKVFLSAPPESLKGAKLLERYLSSIQNGRSVVPDLIPVDGSSEDLFLNEVVEQLKALGVEEIYKDYHIAGTEIDLLFIHNGKTVSIDLVGFPGDYEESFTFERYKMLFRIGIKIIVLPYSSWVKQKEQCMSVLKEACGE